MPLITHFNEITFEIHTFAFKEIIWNNHLQNGVNFVQTTIVKCVFHWPGGRTGCHTRAMTHSACVFSDQEERTRSIEQFRNKEKDVLVATDVASKGLDFPNIQHVLNYDMPEDIENYGESARDEFINLCFLMLLPGIYQILTRLSLIEISMA